MNVFEDLVDAHYQALYRFALSLTRDADAAADLVQDTFCTWAEKGGQLNDPSKAKTWLFTTLYRGFLNRRRRAARFPEEPLDEQTAGEAPGNEQDTERQMDGQRALELLAAMDETFRAPLTLFYLQQHSYRDIAEILDVPVGTVMSRLSRGKEMLRRKMMAEPSSAPKNILLLQNETPQRHHG
jgi:RNA polymerase sigma factor (sigma-70 family)